MSFGFNLKKIRQDNKLTQEELAKKVNTSRSNIANYENDKNMPSADILEKLSKNLNCSIDYLMGRSYYRNYEEFQKLDEFVSNYALTQSQEDATLIANTLNYINTHKNENIDEIISDAIKTLSDEKKEVLSTILYHLHYRYHQKRPSSDVKESPKSNTSSNNLYYMCPVYGQISAGQPNWAEECIEGRLPLDSDLMGIVNPEEHFFLRVNRRINE